MTQAERIAAVSGRIDPGMLVAFIHDDLCRSLVVDRLAPAFDRVWEVTSWSWTLKSERRAAVLRAIGGNLAQVLAAAVQVPTDAAGEVLRQLLAGQVPQAGDGSALEAQALALEWAAAANPSLKQKADALLTRVVQRDALRAYDNQLAQGFFGRDAEVDRLRKFVAQDSAPGLIPVLPVSGIGGSGKSTLLAHALRPFLEAAFDHCTAPMIVSMDFDRRCFLAGAELELSMELSRQLALYFREISSELVGLRDTVARQRAGRAESAKSQYDANLESVSRHGDEFDYLAAPILKAAGVSQRPVVLVLDTFEEWQRASSEPLSQNSPVWRVMNWLSRVGSAWQLAMRVVISGRAPLPRDVQLQVVTPPIELGELKRKEAIALLRSLGLPVGAARAVARTAGGMPLALKLAARYYLRLPVERRAAFLNDTEAEVQGLGDELRQGVLYRRFLDHIPDERARKLAHPGLALRRVSKELIREVLAGPCDLGVLDDQVAEKLFLLLAKEVWLVEQQWPVLVHRPELRTAMLRSMRGDPTRSEDLKNVHRAAASWYASRPGGDELDRAEALYHGLMVAPSDAFDDVVEGAETSLLQLVAQSAGDLPNAVRVQLLDRLGMRVTAADAASLPVERRARWAERQADELVRAGQPGRALAVWRQYAEGRAPGAWYGAALFQSLRWDEGSVLRDLPLPVGSLRYLYLMSFVLELKDVRAALGLRYRLDAETAKRVNLADRRSTAIAALEDAYFARVLAGGRVLPLNVDAIRRWLGNSSMDATRGLRVRSAFPDLEFRPRSPAIKGFLASAFRPTAGFLEGMIAMLRRQGSNASATAEFEKEIAAALRDGLNSAHVLGGWSDQFARCVQDDLTAAGSKDLMPLLAGCGSDEPEWRAAVCTALAAVRPEKVLDVAAVLELELGDWTPADLRIVEFEKLTIYNARQAWKRAVEYADRCGLMPALMDVAAVHVDRKLAGVADAYLQWRRRVSAFIDEADVPDRQNGIHAPYPGVHTQTFRRESPMTMHPVNSLEFIETAALGVEDRLESTLQDSGLQLDKLPGGVVAGNTLIDYSATSSEAMRSAVSLAMIFAGRVAVKQLDAGASDDERLAAYTTSLAKLGFSISGTAVQRARFSKKGLFVHKAIIPFLTIALGGAGVGPIILAALNSLSKIDEGRPWITLFDRQSRRTESRELHFAAVSSDAVTTTIRLVVARLAYRETNTNVLFAKVDDVTAEFESATTHITGNNQLLAVLGPKLHGRMTSDISDYIATVEVAEANG